MYEMETNFSAQEREALLGDDSESVSGESVMSEEGWSSVATDTDDGQTRKRTSRKKSDKKSSSKGLSQKERAMKQRMYEYRSGLANMPAYEVIQNSIHVQTGNIDLQFCDDASAGWCVRVCVCVCVRACMGVGVR